MKPQYKKGVEARKNFEDGMRKLFRAIAMVHADAAWMKTHRVVVQRGQAFALRLRPERRWILEIASSVVIVGMVSFVWAHWPASTKVAPQQGVFASIDESKFLLRLSGSNTIGSVLVPELVRAWLVSVGASGVQETQRVGPDANKIPEWLIRARLNGNPVEVEVKGHGSATAFRGMAEGDADIGMASREMNSAEVAQLMNDFVGFALSVEGQNIVRKARFAPPLGEAFIKVVNSLLRHVRSDAVLRQTRWIHLSGEDIPGCVRGNRRIDENVAVKIRGST